MAAANRLNSYKILNVHDVSRMLKIPVSTIYELARNRKLRGAKVGRQWRFLESDIIELLHSDGNISGTFSPAGENRQHPRLKTHLPASIKGLLPETNGSVINGTVRDLSESSVFVATESIQAESAVRPLAGDDPVEISFEIQNGNGHPIAVTVQGRVTRRVKGAVTGFAVLFKNPSSKFRKAVQAYVG